MKNETTVEKDSQEGGRMELASRSDESAREPDATARDNNLRANLSPAEQGSISAEKLIGASVHDANDENIGEIGDILLTDEQISGFVLDVGGFLGIGAKPVAVDINSIEIRTDESGKLWVFTPFTKEQLEQQREYSESDYENNPNDVILR